MNRLERFVYFVSRWLNWVGAAALIIMLILVCGNILGRVFSHPIKGVFELVGFLGGALSACAMGFTQMRRGHISVEIVIIRVRPRIRAIIESITSIISVVLFALIAWQHAEFATATWKAGEVSETLKIPFFHLIYGVAFGCAVFCLVLLVDFFKAFSKAVKK
jgi:TRAP-type C4-dicarboxylate transport system permease small subunit